MSFVTGQKPTFSGLMQIVGDWLESASQAVNGFRVRTLAGNTLTLSHDDTAGKVESVNGPLKLVGVGGVEFPGGLNLPDNVALPAGKVFALSIPTTGTTAARPLVPALGNEYFDTDLDMWVKWNGAEWRSLTGVAL